jgi:hypothetical protein
MKLSKRVNYKKVTKKGKNGKKSNRVKNSIQSKKRQNRKKNKKTQKGGVSLNCQNQYMVDKKLFRDETGTHVYSIETQTVNERGEGEGEPVAEPKFIVRCGAEPEKHIELSGTSELAELITNVVLAKIAAVTSSETLEEPENEEPENEGVNVSLDVDDEQEQQSFIETSVNKLIENGTFEEIIREFNKFTGLSTLPRIELEALKILRKFKSGNEPNTNKLITEGQTKSLEQLKEELKQAFEALLSKEQFYTLSTNNTTPTNVSRIRNLFEKTTQTGGFLIEIIVGLIVLASVDLLLSRINKNKHNNLNTKILELYEKETSGTLSETEKKKLKKYKNKRAKIEANITKKKFGFNFNL